MNRPVKVHWNLNEGGFSVTCRKDGKVIKTLRDKITIINPVAKLQEGKYLKASVGKREVCAWISGDMVDYQEIKGDQLHYNPWKSRHFTNKSSGESIPFNELMGSMVTFETEKDAEGNVVLKLDHRNKMSPYPVITLGE